MQLQLNRCTSRRTAAQPPPVGMMTERGHWGLEHKEPHETEASFQSKFSLKILNKNFNPSLDCQIKKLLLNDYEKKEALGKRQ